MSICAAGLTIETTDRGEGPVFDAFFAGYDRAFVLPDEKEDADGLRACLALNHGAAGEHLRAAFGPFRELCLLARDADGGVVGGANFIAMPAPDPERRATANLNYLYVDPAARGRGNLRRLVAAVMEIVGALFADAAGSLAPLVFIEQNDPFAMSAEAYASDCAASGLDQIDRLRIWTRLGAKLVDFPYVQPALSAEQGPDATLVYSVLGTDAGSLDAALMRHHLAAFYGISVLKGAPLAADRTASAALAALDAKAAAGARVQLIDLAPLLGLITRREGVAAALGFVPTSVRDAWHRSLA